MSRLLVNRDFTEDGVEKKAGDEMLFEGKSSDFSIMFNATVSFWVYDCLKPLFVTKIMKPLLLCQMPVMTEANHRHTHFIEFLSN